MSTAKVLFELDPDLGRALYSTGDEIPLKITNLGGDTLYPRRITVSNTSGSEYIDWGDGLDPSITRTNIAIDPGNSLVVILKGFQNDYQYSPDVMLTSTSGDATLQNSLRLTIRDITTGIVGDDLCISGRFADNVSPYTANPAKEIKIWFKNLSDSVTLESVSVLNTVTGIDSKTYYWPGTPGELAPGEELLVTGTTNYSGNNSNIFLGDIDYSFNNSGSVYSSTTYRNIYPEVKNSLELTYSQDDVTPTLDAVETFYLDVKNTGTAEVAINVSSSFSGNLYFSDLVGPGTVSSFSVSRAWSASDMAAGELEHVYSVIGTWSYYGSPDISNIVAVNQKISSSEEPEVIKNTVLPTITETDGVLQLNAGEWTPSDVDLSCIWIKDGEWLSYTEGNFTFNTHLGHVGSTFTAVVIASKSGMDNVLTATSNAYHVDMLRLEQVTPFSIQGTGKVGEYLHINLGQWLPEGVYPLHTWTVDGVPVEGANGGVFLVQPEHVGKYIANMAESKDDYILPEKFFSNSIYIKDSVVTESNFISVKAYTLNASLGTVLVDFDLVNTGNTNIYVNDVDFNLEIDHVNFEWSGEEGILFPGDSLSGDFVYAMSADEKVSGLLDVHVSVSGYYLGGNPLVAEDSYSLIFDPVEVNDGYLSLDELKAGFLPVNSWVNDWDEFAKIKIAVASEYIDQLFRRAGYTVADRILTGDLSERVLKDVVSSMVLRVVQYNAEVGVLTPASQTESVDKFSITTSFRQGEASPNIFLRAEEKRQLGLGSVSVTHGSMISDGS